MSEQEILNGIKALSESIGVTTSKIVSHYASRYIWASIGYILFAFCLFSSSIVAFKSFQKRAKYDEYDEDTWIVWSWIIITTGFIISTLIVFSQFGDLLAPTGAAIHQLITDVRG